VPNTCRQISSGFGLAVPDPDAATDLAGGEVVFGAAAGVFDGEVPPVPALPHAAASPKTAAAATPTTAFLMSATIFVLSGVTALWERPRHIR